MVCTCEIFLKDIYVECTRTVDTIRRLEKEEIRLHIHDDSENIIIPVHYGQMTQVMPCMPMDSLTDGFRMRQDVSHRRADDSDFAFFQVCPKFNGFNNRCREQ